MEKIKLGLFDIFAYLLPGIFILFSFYLLINETNDVIVLLFSVISSMNFATAMVTLVACYICGFLGQFVAYELFKILSKLFWKKRMANNETSFGKLEDKIVQIRHF